MPRLARVPWLLSKLFLLFDFSGNPMRPDILGNHRQRIAIVGSGIAGHTAAWALSKIHHVTLYEADDRFGGHAHTVDVDLGGVPTPVDTGFIVYNELNYPNLIKLFETLGVKTKTSNMSFGLSLQGGSFEYRSDASRAALFAQKRNMVNPRYIRMLLELLDFYKQGTSLIHRPDIASITLGGLVKELGLSRYFVDRHLVPMAACIWSASYDQILDFPAATFVRFFTNHGLFNIGNRPQWRTVEGGSRTYVQALHADMTARRFRNAPVQSVVRMGREVMVHAGGMAPQVYDHVVLACHGDQALKLIATPSRQETELLSQFRYSNNIAVLHKDARLMPRRKQVWSSWNYVAPTNLDPASEVPITYWMNLLQGLDPRHDVFVSLNPRQDIEPSLIFKTMQYTHPIFDAPAIAAQARQADIQGVDRLWFCGSYWGYGFHEDACASGMAVARALGAAPLQEKTQMPLLMAAE
jgi:hypothetical protein